MPKNLTIWKVTDFYIDKNKSGQICLFYQIQKYKLNGAAQNEIIVLEFPIFPDLDDMLRENIERSIKIHSTKTFKDKRFAELTFNWCQFRKFWIFDANNNLVKAHWSKDQANNFLTKHGTPDMKIWKLTAFAFDLGIVGSLYLFFKNDQKKETKKVFHLFSPNRNSLNGIRLFKALYGGFYKAHTDEKRKSQVIVFDFKQVSRKWLVLSPNMSIVNSLSDKSVALDWTRKTNKQ